MCLSAQYQSRKYHFHRCGFPHYCSSWEPRRWRNDILVHKSARELKQLAETMKPQPQFNSLTLLILLSSLDQRGSLLVPLLEFQFLSRILPGFIHHRAFYGHDYPFYSFRFFLFYYTTLIFTQQTRPYFGNKYVSLFLMSINSPNLNIRQVFRDFLLTTVTSGLSIRNIIKRAI